MCLCVAKITGRCDTKKELNAQHWKTENQWIITYCHRIGRVFGYWFDIISMSMFWMLGWRRRQRRCHDIDCYWMTCRICLKIRKKSSSSNNNNHNIELKSSHTVWSWFFDIFVSSLRQWTVFTEHICSRTKDEIIKRKPSLKKTSRSKKVKIMPFSRRMYRRSELIHFYIIQILVGFFFVYLHQMRADRQAEETIAWWTYLMYLIFGLGSDFLP